MRRKRKGLLWSFGVYDPYTDTQIVKVKNLKEDQIENAIKEFRKKF